MNLGYITDDVSQCIHRMYLIHNMYLRQGQEKGHRLSSKKYSFIEVLYNTRDSNQQCKNGSFAVLAVVVVMEKVYWVPVRLRGAALEAS